jgi:hypothetical protein
VEAPVTSFYDIHEFKRYELLTETLRRLMIADVDSLHELAELENKPPEQIWADICKTRQVEPCSIPDRVLAGF